MQPYQIALIALAAILVLLLAAATLLYIRLPHIVTAKTRTAFENDSLKKPTDYEKYAERVRRVKNISYDSPLPNSVYDLYLPEGDHPEASLPVIFWIHGGGFTAGTKDGTEILCTMLCSEGYAVLSADYAYAPQYKFPSVAAQIGRAVSSLSKLRNAYPELDLNRVIIGGDSAGGHYCAQYAAAHSNPQYAAAIGVEKADVRLAGVVLCCAPLDIATMLPPHNFKWKLLADTFFNGYFGFSPKKKKRGKELSDLSRYVTKEFPPSFITDGNTFSFEKQNRQFGKCLAEHGIRTDELYFDKEKKGTVNHEYLFELDTEIAAEGYGRLLDFLKTIGK